MLKTLAGQVKEFKWPSILTPVMMVLEVIMEMVIPLLMASIIDNGVEKGDMNHILRVGGLMIVAALFGLLFGLLGGAFGARASTGFARNLRMTMFENIQTFSFANIDKFSTAGLVTRLTTDVTNLQMAYQMILRMFVRAPISLIVAMSMSFYISSRLATVYLVAVVVLAFFLVLIMSRVTGYFRQVFEKYDDLNASVQENVTGIRVVKAYVRENYERDKFKKASANLYRMFIKAEKTLTWNMPIMMSTVYTCILLISWLGAKMIVQNELTTGELMSMLAYCMNILMSLMMMSMVFVMVTMSYASAKRISEVLNEKSSLTNPEHPDYEIPDGSISFEHVNFRYRQESENNVLKDVTLEIKSGETIGLIGGTGSSKSTLISLISRLYDVNDGCVRVGGKDVRTYDLDTLRRQVAVVLQKNVLFSGTILENLRWGDADATEEECIHAAKLACADEFISQFPDGYNTYIEQGGTNVSGGQKQRLCIARALLRKPRVLILDDSTSAVDTATDARIRRAFREEIPGTTKIIISQRISSVMDADRILVLEDGQVNGFGTHEELLENNDIYREIYESQMNAGGDFDETPGNFDAAYRDADFDAAGGEN
ncbi:MAG: ABC transporter ATP-binding protein [Lachnospiraceae bacterium]|nr:ABC transporter ATP-binding protein [Lachnospiraceae bacterium]